MFAGFQKIVRVGAYIRVSAHSYHIYFVYRFCYLRSLLRGESPRCIMSNLRLIGLHLDCLWFTAEAL